MTNDRYGTKNKGVYQTAQQINAHKIILRAVINKNVFAHQINHAMDVYNLSWISVVLMNIIISDIFCTQYPLILSVDL